MVTYRHNESKGENKMDMTLSAIILFGAMAIGLSQMPRVFRDLWAEIKTLYNIK